MLLGFTQPITLPCVSFLTHGIIEILTPACDLGPSVLAERPVPLRVVAVRRRVDLEEAAGLPAVLVELRAVLQVHDVSCREVA